MTKATKPSIIPDDAIYVVFGMIYPSILKENKADSFPVAATVATLVFTATANAHFLAL